MTAGLTIKVGGIVALARRKRFEDWAESRSDSAGGRCLACSCDCGVWMCVCARARARVCVCDFTPSYKAGLLTF